MRPCRRIQVAALAIVLSPLGAVGAAETTRVGALLDRVNTLLLGPNPTEASAKEGLQSLLSAIDASSSRAALPAGFRTKLAQARGTGPGPENGALLAECYRLAHGKPFRMPESIDSFEAAVDHARGLVEAARGLIEKGQSREAVGVLLEVAMVVATPIEGH